MKLFPIKLDMRVTLLSVIALTGIGCEAEKDKKISCQFPGTMASAAKDRVAYQFPATIDSLVSVYSREIGVDKSVLLLSTDGAGITVLEINEREIIQEHCVDSTFAYRGRYLSLDGYDLPVVLWSDVFLAGRKKESGYDVIGGGVVIVFNHNGRVLNVVRNQ